MPGKDSPEYHRTKLEEVMLNAGCILPQTSEKGQKIFMNKDVVDLKRSAGGLKTLRNKLLKHGTAVPTTMAAIYQEIKCMELKADPDTPCG